MVDVIKVDLEISKIEYLVASVLEQGVDSDQAEQLLKIAKMIKKELKTK